MAARDYEDVLQCSLPCFEGLLPDAEDKTVLNVIFDFATWHALAKSRIHSDSSLAVLQAVTFSLGRQLRRFAMTVCPKFKTKETPGEMAARVRRHITAAKKAQFNPAKAAQTNPTSNDTRKTAKAFNLQMYKLHSLGDYVRTITMFGTTDSYSTQIGEQEHHRVKLFYARTNKRNHVKQIAILERRQHRLRHIHTRHAMTKKATRKGPDLRPHEKDPLPKGNPEDRYQMSASRRYPLDLHTWLAENHGDPAIVDFIPKLKDHILRCIPGNKIADTEETTLRQRSHLHIINDRIFWHKILRINYTTYDVRRNQDSINPRTRSDVIVLANKTDPDCTHPYWYARVIGIFHADVCYNDPDGTMADMRRFQIDFLWVRWYGFDGKHKSGFTAKRPHWVGFVNGSDAEAFGFISPANVIQVVHLLPVYRLGTTSDFLAPSIARRPNENDQDYERYSVAMWADRDMVYRYCGLGIGHMATWDATRVFREDLWKAFKLPGELLDPLDLAEMDLDYISDSDDSGSECNSTLTAQDPDSEGTDEGPGSDIDDEAWETDSNECDIGYDDEEDELDARCDEDDNEDDEGG
ncbi:uncharacterized protein ARMOST_16442 [Armillaria ostoyae]|uniref:Uncharacterized protein n=1 Tax=Armillaria ostoyae TaxID=47428 RepID=A0A284RW79_ARMOS|nr:uncharacterized protein ARMOST_16442 [Armillaria ostoyae]